MRIEVTCKEYNKALREFFKEDPKSALRNGFLPYESEVEDTDAYVTVVGSENNVFMKRLMKENKHGPEIETEPVHIDMKTVYEIDAKGILKSK